MENLENNTTKRSDSGDAINSSLRQLRTATVVIGSTGAGYTAADCDYLCDGTNDLAQFNAAIGSMSSGGEVKVLNGEYIFTSPLVISASNINLLGCGRGNTTLRMTGARNTNPGAANAQSNNAVIFLFGNNNLIEGFTLAHGTTDTSGISYGIYLPNYNGSNTITGNTFANNNSSSNSYGIFTERGNGSNTVTDNVFSNYSDSSASYGMYMEHNDNIIMGNKCNNYSNNNNSYGIFLNRHGNTVTNNKCNNYSNDNDSYSYGIYVDSSTSNLVSSNTCACSGGNSYDIYISGDNNTITGNMCDGGNVGNIYGIFMNGSNNTVTGNTCSNSNGGGGGDSYGIYIDTDSSNNTVTGNMCSNNSATKDDSYISYGIFMQNGNKNTVTGNTCANGANIGNSYGIYMNGGDSNIITNNTCANSSYNISGSYNSYGIYTNGSNNNVITDNMCANFNDNNSGSCYGIYIDDNSSGNTISFVAAGKTDPFSGFALYIAGTGNEYNQIINCNLHNWAQYGTGVFTTDGSTADTLPGSSTTIEDFSAIGTGSVAGFNMV